MGINFFAELSATTRAHCAAHGFTSAELYGTTPNADELAVSHLIDMGVPAEAAIPVFRPRKAKYLKYWPRTPIQQLGYVEEQIKQGCYQPTEV